MTRSHSFRRTIVSVALAAFVCLPMHAESKEMIQLQTQVQALQDAIAKLQQTNDESFGMLKQLIQQTADSVNTMSTTVNGLKLSMQNQQDAIGTSNQQLSGQVQSLNDSIDELKARMARMEKALNTIQSQQQTTNATLSSLPQGGIPAGPPQAAPSASPNSAQGTTPESGTDNNPPPSTASNTPPPSSTQPSNTRQSNTEPSNTEPGPVPTSAQPSAGDMYRGAYADYISARYALASSEFTDLIKAYPDDNLSGNGYYYLGEMQMRTHHPSLAIKDYDEVLTRYVDNAKVPAAQLHKAQALIETHQNEAAERELHSLIQRFPVSPEASQARAKLNGLRSAPHE
jgi:TolA-binding protein